MSRRLYKNSIIQYPSDYTCIKPLLLPYQAEPTLILLVGAFKQ